MPTNRPQINFTGAYIKVPCKDCTERFTGCHTVCVKYEDYKQDLEAEKERYKASRETDRIYNEYVSESIKRNKKV
jgi:hypothetical protein